MRSADDIPADYAIIEVSAEYIAHVSTRALEFSYWQDAGRPSWVYRVDPARPERNEKRHIHIAKKKHVTAKSRQASWNDDGTRHDRKTFDESVGSLKIVREIAREVLELSPVITLEFIVDFQMPLLVSPEDIAGSTSSSYKRIDVIVMRLRYRQR